MTLRYLTYNVEIQKEYGDIPLVVIASGVPNPAFGDVAQEYQAYWIQQSRVLAAKSSRGEFLLAEDSAHNLHQEAEDLVYESILSILKNHDN